MTNTKKNNNKINKNRREVESGEVSEVSEEEGGFVDFLLPPN
jgi:hypothetical protein